MSNLVIVAIPDKNDHVWKISSEKVPHLTLLFLGDTDQISNLDKIVEFVEHAASTTLNRFYLSVDHRGELGEDQADVLFFKKDPYSYKAIRNFREALLKDNNVRTAYDSATQFDGPWNPHLTLGYPATPAKPDERDYGFYSVEFNKISVWTTDFEGPEFLLKDYWDEYETLDAIPMDVAMSGLSHFGVKGMKWESVSDSGAEFLEHYGIKGMHWGRRKATPPRAVTPSAVSRVPHGVKRKTKIEVEGGENHPAHEDAIKVAEARAKLRNSGTAALSNKELREVANRLQLEQQVKQLAAPRGKSFVTNLLKQQGQQSAGRVITRKAVARGF